jgi:hypothetical protein
MSGRLFALALIGVLISASNWVYSEETREAQETQEAQEAQSTEPAQPPDPTASGSQDEEHEGDEEDEVVDVASDVFIPTEEISEDAAVPFPVDI